MRTLCMFEFNLDCSKNASEVTLKMQLGLLTRDRLFMKSLLGRANAFALCDNLSPERQLLLCCFNLF
jgi:hypothetical protein